MKQVISAMALCGFGLVLLASGVASQETKGSAKFFTPFGWKFLKLTDEQKVKMGKVQSEFKNKIKELEDKLKAVKDEQHSELVKLLTPEQRKMLQSKASVDEKSAKTEEKKKSDKEKDK